MNSLISAHELSRLLAIRDLTDPTLGTHALQLLVLALHQQLQAAWGCAVRVHRGSPIITIQDNYDRLHYSNEAVVRDTRYTRQVSPTEVLRTQMTGLIPPLLTELAREAVRDQLLVCPGMVYRRDCIDRLHTGEPHQIDLWRVRCGEPLEKKDLLQMVEIVVEAVLPGRRWRTQPACHPYTTGGEQIDVWDRGEWIEIGECGLALEDLLSNCGLPVPPCSGLAMGLGLDRILMLRKGMDDIRLLRSNEPRVREQLLDLLPYRAVSCMPAVARDLSIVLDEPLDAEILGDRIRSSLRERADLVESVAVLSHVQGDALPPHVTERLGIRPDQVNLLLRVVLRSLDRTLTHQECDGLRDEMYAALHRGTRWHWASAR
jgi:phenylalanyl-tRNA synthetase alpha chain